MKPTDKLIDQAIEEAKRARWYLPEEAEVFIEQRLKQVAEAARADRDKEILEMLNLRKACLCMMPEHCDATGWNACSDRIIDFLSSNNNEAHDQPK